VSKIARVKFIRDKEPNIKALTASSKVLDGALYIATDTGTMWMGTSATSLIQIKDNINTNTTYTLTKSGNTITLKGSDGSSVNVTDSNTIYNNATASAAGLMSAADKSKLDSVATGANKTVVDASFVADSTNPVQSKVVKSALDGKSNTGHKHVKADITDFPTSMPASDVYAWAKASSKPSYSWSEISNRPSIPSVGNGTVTITQNGATKGSFTLNQSGNATIALTDNNTVYSLPAATSSTLGGVKVGSNITNSSGTISLTKANVTSALGYTPPTSDTNTWRPEEVIISSTQPSASTCKLWIKI
jgi:hypothetical protein